MGLVIALIGFGLLVTGALMTKAGKQRPHDRVLLPVGRVALGVGSVVATIGACWLVVGGL